MKKLSLLLISLLACMTLSAGEVTEEEALQKARQFMKGKQFKQRNLRRAASTTGNNSYYVFNAENNDGFVIVSGDDRTTAILGYGNTGNLDMKNLPENVKWWLESYARQIAALDTSLEPVASTTRRSSKAAITPLITAKWNQGTPYNYMCPDGSYKDWDEEGYNVDNRCVTGCVATAMAQVMYYWQWPKTCPTLDSYTTSGHTIKALPATTFDYDKMTDTYKYKETGEAADEVAKLMRYCGQAVQMKYTPSSSGANLTSRTLSTVFQYSKNVRFLSRDGYTTTQWEAIVYDELAAKRPVLYSGSTETSGHQFIIDGYDGNGLFHINWGWGGSPDSYYVLSIADPGIEQGAGGSEGAFQYGQDALIGVEPTKDGEILLPKLSSWISSSIEPANYSRDGASASFTDVNLYGEIGVYYNLKPESSYAAEIGWALYQNDELKGVVSSESTTIPVLEAGTNKYLSNYRSATFGAGLSTGTYQLCQVYRFDGETEWKRCISYDVCLLAEVTPTTLTVRLADTNNMSFVVNSINTSDYPEVNKPVEVKMNITNDGESKNQIVNLWMRKQGASAWNKVAQSTSYVDPGKSGDVVMSFKPTEAGTFDLKVTAGSSTTVLETTTVKIASSEQVVVDNVTYLCTPDYQRARVIGFEDEDRTITSVTIPSTVTTKNGKSCKVIAIGDNAFYNWYSLRTVTISEGVQTIGYEAFAYCSNLNRINLPSTLTSIDEGIFYGCRSLTSVASYIQNPSAGSDKTFANRSWNEETEDNDYFPSPATLYVPIGTKAKYEALSGWTWFAAIEEGEPKEAVVDGLRYAYSTGGTTATVIQDDSYKDKDLTEVNIPATVKIDGKDYSVTAIGDEAFMRCFYITSLTLPNTLKTIGEYAFWNCSGLKVITIPASVKEIGESAFACMYGLRTVISRIEEPFEINKNTFVEGKWNEETSDYEYSPISATLYIPIGTKAKYEALSGWTWFAAIEEGEPKEAVVDGLRYAYSTGGTTATVIQDDSYKDKDLTEVNIPATVKIDGKDYDVTAIGEKAFLYCYNLSEIKLSNKLKTIGDYAFYCCYNVMSITIPASVEEIGESAFAYLGSPLTIVSHITEPFDIDKISFEQWGGDGDDPTLCVPYGTKAKYEALDGWSVFTTIIEIGDADGDGSIDVNDVTSTINYILGKPVASFFQGAADVDGDGTIDVNDVQGIIDRALGK